MSDVIASQPSLLQMISRFGIQLGVGERTVREVCEASKVDTNTFLAVANIMKEGPSVAQFYVDKIHMPTLMRHLRSAHDFFLDFQLLRIRRKLLEAIIERFGGGPVGLDNIAAAIGEVRDTIEDVIEPYLIQQGLLQRTPRGRMVTATTWEHFGLPVPTAQRGASETED